MIKHKDRSLIVNADDFGLHISVNEAVERAHRDGVLTSASLVAAGEAFEDAVAIAKRNAGLGVGLHLTLNGEKPVSRAGSIASLVDADGRFFESHNRLCLDILSGKVAMDHLAKECEAQITKLLDAGIVPTHIDSHRHIHLFPPVMKILKPLLERHNVRKMRWLNIPLSDYSIDIGKIGVSLVLRCANSGSGKNYAHPDFFVGFFKSGRIDRQYILSALKKLMPGVTEINFHPGTDNGLMKKKYGCWAGYYNWGCDWEREFSILVDPGVRDLIESSGISLTNYRSL